MLWPLPVLCKLIKNILDSVKLAKREAERDENIRFAFKFKFFVVDFRIRKTHTTGFAPRFITRESFRVSTISSLSRPFSFVPTST